MCRFSFICLFLKVMKYLVQCYTFSKLSAKDAHHLSTEMAQQSNNEARRYHNLFLNQTWEKIQILGSYSVFLPADPLVKDDSKDWWSSKKVWSPLMSMGFISLLLAPDNKLVQDQSS